MKKVNYQKLSLVRQIEFGDEPREEIARKLHDQWLITNGLGGYASGTIAGALTWRYHGMLIAALPPPLGRTLMFNHLAESLSFPDGRTFDFGGELGMDNENPGELYLRSFRLENQLPVWRYEIDGVVLEKRLLMPYLQNTVHITYTLKSSRSEARLVLRPSLHFRPFEGNVGAPLEREYEVRVRGSRYEIDSHENYPPLRMTVQGSLSRFTTSGGGTREIFYERDAERGYESRGNLWSPGFFTVEMKADVPVTLVASTEDWHTILAFDPEAALQTERSRRERLLRIADPRAQQGTAAELVLAADQFIMVPPGRIKNSARARASGDELRSVIAGYHWFTDWGRDTMISLEGLTLVTGRHHEAGWILRTFGQYVRYGLIPNMFPEGQNEGLYHTADATLWFFHALDRYLRATGDRETLVGLLPTLREIVEQHLKGTKYGIGVDPEDGLLRQGAEGYQLTWMDAKVGDWVVTPRRGKAVEINALWHNALRLLEGWLREEEEAESAEEMAEHARRVRESFNQRFWNEKLKCLFDIVDGEDGDDAAIRPNQLFSFSLQYPVLEQSRWAAVLTCVHKNLLTPVGLRSLSREHPDYKPKYFGDLRARDAAYHQGTVWGWLIGPFIDAWLKVHPEDLAGAREFLQSFVPHLSEGCVGSISEVFDAEAPFAQRGCVAQAWSVAEVLRCYVITSDQR